MVVVQRCRRRRRIAVYAQGELALGEERPLLLVVGGPGSLPRRRRRRPVVERGVGEEGRLKMWTHRLVFLSGRPLISRH